MGRHDWYRLTSWSEEDQAAFYSKLNRSRSVFNKAQYARIQALYLERTGDPELIKAATELLNRVINEWPDPFSLPDAYQQIARCHVYFKEFDKAVEIYRNALKAEDNTISRTNAPFEFVWLIVRKEMKELYKEALDVLEHHVKVLIFPYHEFIYYGVQALIYSDSGLKNEASVAAKRALGAAAKTDSGFTYHKREGLVQKQEDVLMEKLWKIATEK